MASRKSMQEQIWKYVVPSIKGYGDMIDFLLNRMTEEQIGDVLCELMTTENSEEEDEEV